MHDREAKGSGLSSKVKYGVSWGMVGEVNRFKCPFKGSIFRSPSYTVIGLPTHISYNQLLGTPDFSNRNCMPKTSDLKVGSSLVTSLPSQRGWKTDVLKEIELVNKGKESKDEFHIARKSNNRLQESDYTLSDSQYVGRKVCKKYEGYEQPFTGVIHSHDTDVETGDSIWEVIYDDGDRSYYNHPQLMEILTPLNGNKMPDLCMHINNKNEYYVSKSKDTFQDVCRAFDIPTAWNQLHYNWLPP